MLHGVSFLDWILTDKYLELIDQQNLPMVAGSWPLCLETPNHQDGKYSSGTSPSLE